MEGPFTHRIQRFLVRLLFSGGILLWSYFSGSKAVALYTVAFLAYALAVLIWELRSDSQRPESRILIYTDVLASGLLVALSGGVDSDFYLLFYFITAMRAPYRSWTEAMALPGACTGAYLVAVSVPVIPVDRLQWFHVIIRVSLLWFLAPLLRIIGLRSIGDRERAQRLTRELSATHDEVRRYTAALEKSNARKDQRLAEITLLHRFLQDVRSAEDHRSACDVVLKYAAEGGEAPWTFILYHSGNGKEEREVRSWGDPPSALRDWVEGPGTVGRWRDAGDGTRLDRGGSGTETVYAFVRGLKEGIHMALVLAYPEEDIGLEEGQSKVISALMDSLEMEVELIHLRHSLRQANRELVDSNHHLMRLHELQHELSEAFLTHESGMAEGVIQGAQEIMAKELFELDRLNLFIPNHESGMLECRTSVGIEGYPLEKIKVPLDERGGAISKAFREGRTIIFDGEGKVPEELRLAEPFSRIPAIRSRIFVIVPLIDHQKNVLGVIGADRKYTHRPIPHETVTMLEFFARHVAMVLAVQGTREDGSGLTDPAREN